MWPLVRGLIACFLECVRGFEVSESECVCLKISGCKLQQSFWATRTCTVWKCWESVSSLCCVCLLSAVRDFVCMCLWGGACTPSQTSFWPPQLTPSCDELSWMLMFCDGCAANKCFWHSTGSHYRSRPNGLARALMSRQVSQPQPLYRSHTLLMQGRTSAPLDQNLE